MYHLISVIRVSLMVMLFCHCANQHKPTMITSSSDVPKLLERGLKIQHGQEWTKVQNAYAKMNSDLLKNPIDEMAALNLAVLFIQEARVTGEHGHYYPAALQMIDHILNHASLDADEKFLARRTQAGVLLSLHQFDKALAVGKEALEMNRYDAQTYGVMVDAYVELGQYQQAVAMADKMVAIRPDLRSYSRVSYLRQIYGDLPGAIEAMKLAVSAGYPTYEETAWAKLKLGELYELVGQGQKAENLYFDILDHRPNYPFALAALGSLYLSQNRLSEAEKFIDEACAIIPEVGFYMEKVKILQQRGREDETNALISEIEAMLQDDELHGHKMGLEYAYLYSELCSKDEEALKYAKKEWLARPDNIDVNKRLAKIYFRQGKSELAQRHLEAAFITESKDAELIELATALAAD